MNDLIKYKNLLCEQGMNSPEAAALLSAHAGDSDFERRARFVRFAYLARTQRELPGGVRTKIVMFLVAVLLLVISGFFLQKAFRMHSDTVEIHD